MIRSLGHWVAFVLSLVAVLAAAAAVQAFAELWSTRVDLTARGDLSLSDSTLALLRDVKDPLQITYYYEGGKRQKASDLLDLFAAHAPALHYELLDLDRNPMRAHDDEVRNYERAVLRYGDRTLVAPASNERSLASAIYRILHQNERVLEFVTGHGERTLAVGMRDQYGEAARVLRDAGYDLRSLPLLQAGAVPEDTAAVILAGPELDYTERELAALDDYLKRGGGVLVLIDPVALPQLEGWIVRHGLKLDDDVVIDGSNRAFGTDGTNLIVPYWRNHPATEGLDKPAVLGRSRSVALASGGQEDPTGQATIVARSDAESFRARDASRTRAGRIEFDPTRDEGGPVGVMGVTLVPSGGKREGRIAIIGDADFASDNFLRLHGNQALLMRAIAWLAPEATAYEGPGIEAADTAPLSSLYVSEQQADRIFATAVFVEPLLVLAIGMGVAIVRRRRR